MGNIKTWLLRAEENFGEEIEAISIGKHDRDEYRESDRRPEFARKALLSREQGLQILDEDYDSSYGSADCFPMYAWTKSRVFFVGEYDGATGLDSVPRNPLACNPCFSGCGEFD